MEKLIAAWNSHVAPPGQAHPLGAPQLWASEAGRVESHRALGQDPGSASLACANQGVNVASPAADLLCAVEMRHYWPPVGSSVWACLTLKRCTVK